LDIDYRGKAVDFSEVLTQAKQLNPEALYIPGYTRDSGLLIRQARSLGIQAVFLGGDAWDEVQRIAGDALDGSFQSSHWHPQVPFPGSAHLQDLYRRKYGTEITSFTAPLAYDAVMLLAEAIRKAGSVERSKIRDALANLKGFQGATGDISFDESRDPQNKEVVMLKWQKGIPIFIQTIKPTP
jgi:branched-chain amino acid transport system substrate-binding protein